MLAGPQLVLELLPGPHSVWTGQGLHPCQFVALRIARRLDRLMRHVEPLVTGEMLLPESDRQPVLWPVLLGGGVANVLVCMIGASLRLVVHQSFCHVQNALLAVHAPAIRRQASN